MAEASNDVDMYESFALTRKLKSAHAFEFQAADEEIVQQIAYRNVETLELRSIERNTIRSFFVSKQI